MTANYIRSFQKLWFILNKFKSSSLNYYDFVDCKINLTGVQLSNLLFSFTKTYMTLLLKLWFTDVTWFAVVFDFCMAMCKKFLALLIAVPIFLN